MTAGLQVTINQINDQAGSLARSLFNVLQNVDEFKAWLDGFSSAQLVSTFSFVQADADILKSAFTDLGDMSSIWKSGTATQTIAGHDFRVFPRKLIGTGLF